MLSVPLVVIALPVSPAPLPTLATMPAPGERLPNGEAEDALAVFQRRGSAEGAMTLRNPEESNSF